LINPVQPLPPDATASSDRLMWNVGVTATRVAVAVAAVAVVWAVGGAVATDDALQVMGFDPDRARLIVALILGAIASSTVSLIGGGIRAATLTGLAAATIWFGRTFIAETGRVLGESGSTGQFDPVGWLLTLASLLVAGIAVAWSAAILAREVRVAVLAAIAALGLRQKRRRRSASKALETPGEQPPRTGWRRGVPLARIVVVGLIAIVTLPVLGDIFNFDPDVHMQTGGARVGLVDDAVGPPAASPLVAVSHPTASSTRPSTGQPSGAGSPAATPGTSASPGVADAAGFPAGLIDGPVKGSLVTSGALGPASWGRPPSGSGRTMTVHLPAPWTGGKSSTATVEVYLPPGYDKGNARYPVFYEAPSTLGSWQNGMAFTTAMDGLMTSGYMPPAIVVFASTAGGPYVDAECADTFDGKEWFNRYMATDVVKWVDSNLRTIATPDARSTLGFSQGGYCSAAIMARHPNVFSTSVSMSGYFQAGIKSGTTPTAWRPFDNDPQQMSASSPIELVPALPASLRSHVMVIMEADPNNHFYGGQARTYATALDNAGVAMAVLLDPRGHSWDAARPDIPAMMRIAALRMTQLGVFDAKR
jgi:enterochelin esterase-like enzyme